MGLNLWKNNMNEVKEIMELLCQCGHPMREHYTMDMKCVKCSCPTFKRVEEDQDE